MTVTTAVTLGLIAIRWILLLVTNLLFFCKRLPPVLLLGWLILPLLANNLRDFRIRQARMLSNYGSLMMLSIQDES
jgi:hypothetical protein